MLPELPLGPFRVPAYPAVVTAAVLLCWALLTRRTRRLGYRTSAVLLWVGLAFPAGAVGGHALAWVVGMATGAPEPGGMTVLGSVLGCLLFSWIYVPRAFGEGPGRLLDAVAFTLPLSIGLGRVACLLNGCCFGAPCPWDGPWAIGAGRYAPGTVAFATYGGEPQRLLFDLPLLFTLQCAMSLVAVEWLYARRIGRRLAPGAVMAFAVALDAAGRVAIEPLRGGMPPGAGHNPWQWVAFAVLIGAAVVLTARARAGALAAT